MTPLAYRNLLLVARRYSRRAGEAEDLVQEALLAAIAAGRDPAEPANRAWLAGAIRNGAAFTARSAARRQQREFAWQALAASSTQTDTVPAAQFLFGLPTSLKSVAALAFSGHSRPEIRYLLGLSDAALRQRIVGLKRELTARGFDMPAATPGLTLGLDYGRLRDALVGKLRREGGLFASHDPDGHLFLIRRSQTGPPRQHADGP